MIFTVKQKVGGFKQFRKVKKAEIKKYVNLAKDLGFDYFYCAENEGSTVYKTDSFPTKEYNEWAILENKKAK